MDDVSVRLSKMMVWKWGETEERTSGETERYDDADNTGDEVDGGSAASNLKMSRVKIGTE